MSYLADATFACGHRDVARLVLPRLAPYSGLGVYVPGLACYGAADRYLGRLHRTLGDDGAARDAFEAALALDTTTGWPTWIAHSTFALASQLATTSRRDDRERARALAADAGTIAESLGMAALAERAFALVELLAGGEPDRAPGLTNREREVLRSLSEGRSNRQIGEELHASQHTIANHVRAILAKTGAANRTGAAAWAHRHGGT
jgi:DNA-binding CsgD family transcriptional regulator